MRNLKWIILSEYTSKLTILRHFLKIFFMIDTYAPLNTYQVLTLCLCKKHFKSKYNPNSSILFLFFRIYNNNIICLLSPKQLFRLHYYYFGGKQ